MKKMRHRILIRLSQLRRGFIRTALNLSGFKIICDHWLYVKELDHTSTVIDLGANKGTFSNAIINQFNSKCYAVEPNLSLFDNLDNVRFPKFNYAITKNDGPIAFYISENHEASSLTQNFQYLWKVDQKQIVEGISWETLLAKLDFTASKIQVLKIDVEGAELDIIDTFKDQNCKNLQQITIEFHHHLNPGSHEKTKQSIRKLLSLGYMAIADAISPTEILFIRKGDFKFNLYQKFFLSIYRQLSFSPY